MKQRPFTRQLVWVAAFGLFAAVRIAAIAGKPTARVNDTAGYLDLSFVGHGRPWVVPLLYSIVPSDGVRVAAQCAISIVCWCVLAYVVVSAVQRPWLQILAASGVLLIGASPQVSRWDLALVSESLALSLTVGAVAAWLLFALRATRTRMVTVWVLTLLWAFTREAHLLLLPLLLVLLAVSLAWRTDRRSRSFLLLALAPIAAWGLIAVRNDAAMTEYNTYALIELRVFGDPERTRWFVQHGMPVTPEIVASRSFVPRRLVHRKLVEAARVPAGLNVPEVVVTGGRPYINWMRDDGPATYLKWLAVHPGYTLEEPLRSLDTMVAPAFDHITPPLDSRAVLPGFLHALIFESYALYVILLIAGLLLTLAVALEHERSSVLAVAVCTLALSVALLYIAWHGSAIEVARHAVVASVTSRVALLMVIVFAVDRLLAGPGAAAQLAEQ